MKLYFRCTVLPLMVALSIGPLTLSAVAKDRSKPTMPGNFRVAAKTAYTVTLTWTPSSDNSGDFNYHLWGAYNVGPAVVLPKTATSYTFTALFPGNYYTFGIYAQDAAGNVSSQANLSAILLPRDTSPPTTAPVLSIDEVGSNYANLSWRPAEDDGPHLSTAIYLDGVFYSGVGRGTTNITLRFLEPGTTYSLTARAIDFSNNVGPFSAPIALNTPPPNPADVLAPTTPANVFEEHFDTEINLRWTASTDDFDDPVNIRYDIFINGQLGDILFGTGRPAIFYGEFGENLIEVFATDTAGNVSEPAVLHLSLP